MYLVSIYFDEKTNKRITEYISLAAKRSGNRFMIEGNVPPHITVSAFEINDGEKILTVLDDCVKGLCPGTLQWAGVGVFFPGAIYLAPVLNRYLQELSERVYGAISGIEGISISSFYRPYQWIPHTTVARTLKKGEMQAAFGAMQESFGMFSGEVVRIGLAKTNPYEEIENWDV